MQNNVSIIIRFKTSTYYLTFISRKIIPGISFYGAFIFFPDFMLINLSYYNGVTDDLNTHLIRKRNQFSELKKIVDFTFSFNVQKSLF